MHRPVLLALLALLAVPGAASAAPAKISPHPSPVSSVGVATVQAANPNAYALRGTATVTADGRTLVKRSVRLGRRSVVTIALRFDGPALGVLRAAGGRATISLRSRRAGGRWSTARRTVKLRLPAGAPPAPAPSPGTPTPPSPGDGGGTPGGNPPAPEGPGPGPGPTPPAPEEPRPTPPASNSWVGRMGEEGSYDDFELTAVDGQLQITKAPLVPVYCFENGGMFRKGLSFEPFDAPGPWTIGTDGLVTKQGISVNSIVSPGARPINYKVTGTTQEPGRITGTFGMSYFDSRYDIFTNKITFTNCSGSQSFEAVPAG